MRCRSPLYLGASSCASGPYQSVIHTVVIRYVMLARSCRRGTELACEARGAWDTRCGPGAYTPTVAALEGEADGPGLLAAALCDVGGPPGRYPLPVDAQAVDAAEGGQRRSLVEAFRV